MSTMLHVELTKEATPLDRLAEAVRATATQLNLLARVVEAPDLDFYYDSQHEGFERQDDELLQRVFWLLEVVPEDAVLHDEYYVVHLVRRGGRPTTGPD